MTRDPSMEADGGRRIARRPGPRRAAPVLLSALVVAAVPPARAADAFRPTFDAATVPVGTTSALPPREPVASSGRGAAPSPAAPSAAALPTLALPGPWPAVEVRTLLIGMHLLGLSFGLGGATMLDFWILRWMRWGYLPDNVVRTFEFVGKAVSAGLVLLWLSGIGFLVLYGLYDPAKLANPKILAKLAIVAALTVNGVVVHRLVLPYVAEACARPLFDGFRRRRRMLFILSGAVSGISWYSAFALGLLHEFNGRVPASTLMGLWLALVLLATAALDVLLSRGTAIRPPRLAEATRSAETARLTPIARARRSGTVHGRAGSSPSSRT